MTVQDLLQHGAECEVAGDLSGAEAAYREADQLLDAEGAIRLGLVLKRRGEVQGAAGAFRRAEDRGHPEAGSSLGNLLSDNGDLDGAKAAYARSIAAGSTDAVLNLGLALAGQGMVDEALGYLRTAQIYYPDAASWAIGKLLEDQGDLAGAGAAYRQGAAAGDAGSAYGLGWVLMKREDQEGARAAFQQANELGHPAASQALEDLDRRAEAQARAETTAKLANVYASACGEVLTAVNACSEIANRAVGARRMAAQRPQHELSIQSFTRFAERSEQEFAPLYRTFDDACAAARDIAAQLLASQPDPAFAEVLLAGIVGDDVLGNVATVKGILTARFGSSPAGFVQGIEEANELIRSGNDDAEGGNIYRRPVPEPPTERACPWCAETIKVAAIICRFCGRDVQAQPSGG